MTADERRPSGLGAIVDASLAAYAERWPLYVLIALASFAVELLIDAGIRALGFSDDVNELAYDVILGAVDTIPMCVITLDIATRALGARATPQALLRSSMRRFPIVAPVVIVTTLAGGPIQVALFGGPQSNLFGLLVIPAVAVLGVFAMPIAIATLESDLPPLAIPGYSIMRGFIISAAWPNLAWVTVGGAIIAVILMLQSIVSDALSARHLGGAALPAIIAIDALCTPAIQAFFTLLFLDFAGRQKRGD